MERKTTKPNTTVTHPKQDALNFENNPYAMRYTRCTNRWTWDKVGVGVAKQRRKV